MATHRLTATARAHPARLHRLRSPLPLVAIALLLTLSPGLGTSRAQQATPAPGPDTGRSKEIICSGEIPAAYQPAGDAIIDVSRTTFQPGTSVTWSEDVLVPSSAFDCVISGSYSLVIEGEAQVIRGGTGERESYPPGTEVTAAAGDTVFLVDNSRTQTYTTSGNEPLVVVSVGLFSTDAPSCVATNSCPPYPSTLTSEWLGGMGVFEWSQTGLQGQDIVATVRRVTLESGGSFSVTYDQPARTWLVEDGRVRWVPVDERVLPLRFARGQHIIFVPLSSAIRVEIRNEAAEPAVLIELELAPALPTSATPVT